MKRSENGIMKRNRIFLIVCAVLLVTTITIQASSKASSVIWKDNFDDGTLDDWFITGRHYTVSTNTYTNWTGSASAVSGKLIFMNENHWDDWTNDRIMNITSCWYQNETTFGQWSFDVYPAENNFIAIDFIRHLPNASVPEVNPPEYDTTFRYALFIVNDSYEAGTTGDTFVQGDFESPTGVSKEDFTGEPCFIFIKDEMDEKQKVFAIKEFSADIITADKLFVQISRDNTSNFVFYVNGEYVFSATDTSPPSTSLDAEGYFFDAFSFGGGSWIDNIIVDDTITLTVPPGTVSSSEAGISLLVFSLAVLVVFRRRREG
ncbi:MAG: hypothetical protein ACXAC6_03705 [Candidatus Hodarchaeales archaeon]|jgi:hypothetical protein